MANQLGLGMLLMIIGWIALVVGIILGNARVVGTGAGVIFLSEMV